MMRQTTFPKTLTISILFCLVASLSFSQVIETATSETVFRQSRARALLIAYMCYEYETDNGTFPIRTADLRWPLDYAKVFEQDTNVNFENLMNDPLSWDPKSQRGGKFRILPVLKKEWVPTACGINLRAGDVYFIVLSSFGDAKYMGDCDVIFEDKLKSGNQYTNPAGSLFYISDREIGEFQRGPDFDRKKLIKEAALKNDASAGPDKLISF